MVEITVLKPPKMKRIRNASYNPADLADYFAMATKQLDEDIKAIERAEKENWARVRRGELP